ncbi:VTT domain-containing protein [Paractinoplanes lichenicola]|uniref:VTT domain-containing protein n=1 Tax=Paractinoplanes lichenicola TaxID=2802976 RepID=A0ABS1VHE8_9ACTN|nr:VTT domain-containing protein [Actinoplanes lichenicola]MBL7253911.1 VTT domain-containing protein [Actinoplanes lichenicola]
MIAVLAAAAVGLLSAFLPFTPAEPYLIAAAATTGAPGVALGVAAAVGQTAGKVLIFLAARGVVRSPWLRRRSEKRTGKEPGKVGRLLARLIAIMDRPRQAIGMLLAGAVTGIPPLLAVSVYLGRTPMRPAVFAAVCLLGRAIRFVTIALAPHLAGY